MEDNQLSLEIPNFFDQHNIVSPVSGIFQSNSIFISLFVRHFQIIHRISKISDGGKMAIRLECSR